MAFANRLKNALIAADKTQRDVSRQMGVAESTVSQWAKGKRIPDLLTTKRLADFLGVTIDSLVSDKPTVDLARENARLLALLKCIKTELRNSDCCCQLCQELYLMIEGE